ncbi:MAG TPA: hypothetical protein ENG48_13095 [Candidatus Atribacteria bacterium]|nr:hypothetical protein [Candidatus Atribacteria bacterium]
MIKIKIILPYYFKKEYLSNTIELNYEQPVSIDQIIKDSKVNSIDVCFVKVGDLVVKRDYIIRNSCDIKFIPAVGGG